MGVMDPNEKKSSIEEMSENKRYCTDCKTTRTPLWRGGPAGPKSLCNACGIRYRKKRRALMGLEKKTEKKSWRSHNTTATTHNTSTTTDTAPTHSRKENVNDNGFSQLLKVRLMGFGNGFLSRRSSSSSSSSSSSPPPPVVVKKQRCQRRRKLKEEEQAAFSLMALSCGSVFA